MSTISTWWVWLIFLLFILGIVALDLLCLGGGKRHKVSTKEALLWTLIWITLALFFNASLWFYLAHQYDTVVANQKSLEFLTAYLIEKSLSVDNIFVFVMIFKYFHIPLEHQRRLLLFGVLGAIVMRLTLILFGLWLVETFDWIFYFFGLLLVISAIKMLTIREQKDNLDRNLIMRATNLFFRTTHETAQGAFFIKKNNLLYLTPLFMALIFIESSDLIFAIDSIPAVFAITRDPFIAFTSNVFAILGLRALYFLLANLNQQFYVLKYGLACILILIAIKMFLHQVVVIPVFITLLLVMSILLLSIILSLLFKK
ncbi:MAG: TerC/Alx family metal homeostasis membrane protein [Legionellaceae bacterium]|nr:TerC/Alx family metal homeostasis membrane protein [Legionellaceae bacterium]